MKPSLSLTGHEAAVVRSLAAEAVGVAEAEAGGAMTIVGTRVSLASLAGNKAGS